MVKYQDKVIRETVLDHIQNIDYYRYTNMKHNSISINMGRKYCNQMYRIPLKKNIQNSIVTDIGTGALKNKQ
jgi:hypothetical protein